MNQAGTLRYRKQSGKGSDYRRAPGTASTAARGKAPRTNELAEPSAGTASGGKLHQGAASVARAVSRSPRRQALLPSVPQAPLPAAKPVPVPHYRPAP